MPAQKKTPGRRQAPRRQPSRGKAQPPRVQEVEPTPVSYDNGDRLDELEQRVDQLTEFTTKNLADIRTLVLDWRDERPPGVLGRFGIELDNPGTFRSRSRLLDLLVATSIDEAFAAELNDFVTGELPGFSEDFQGRVRRVISDRLAGSLFVEGSEEGTKQEET
jgi:hypothetical protein